MSDQSNVPTRHDALPDGSAGERRFRALVENGPLGAVLVGPDARILYTSRSLQRMFGRSGAELLQADGFELIDRRDRDRLVTLFTELVSLPDAVRSAEFRVQRGDGATQWIEATGRNLLHDPDVQAVLITTREIEDRKRAEEDVRRLAAVVESSGDAILTEDLDGTITSWS